MLINRSKIEHEIAWTLERVNGKRKYKDVITRKFEERGFLAGEINAIISGTNPVMQLTEDLLCLLVWILYNSLTALDPELINKISPEKLLTKIEIEKAKNMIVNRKKDSIYPLFIENVNIDADEDYSTIFLLTKIAEWFDNRTFKYNHETQRPLISKFYGGQEGKEIDLNENNVKAIQRNIVEEKQIPDEITLNILQTGDEEIHYDSKKRILTIHSGDVSVIDGWHRLVAARKAYYENPEANFYLKVRIVHWDIDRAKAFIYQKSLGSQLDPFAKKVYDVYNPINQVISKLNTNPKSNLKNKIGSDKTDNSKIKFDIFYDTLNILFNIKSNSEVVSVSNYLKDGFNLITDNNISLLDEKHDDRLLITHMVILSKFYKNIEWEDKVMDMIDRLDIAELLAIPYKTINKVFIKKIEEYLSEKVGDDNV
jgi:hypothetical protein